MTSLEIENCSIIIVQRSSSLDFLDVLDCYQLQCMAACQFCKKCSDCRHFKLLCTDAETIILNSWRQRKSFVVAVRLNSINLKYPKTLPMTVDNLNRRIINSDKEKIFFRKSKKKNFWKNYK